MNNTSPLALIIGGSSGMGKASAEKLLAQGINVWLVARNKAKLAEAKNDLENRFNGSVSVTSVDLYNEAQVDSLIENIEAKEVPIKYLVNAAGYFKPISFIEHSKTDYDNQLGINRATFFITQAAARNMQTNGGGAIVNIGSMWANQAVKATPSSAYSMQKAGLHSLTQHLAMELADSSIRVNAVAPAVVLSTIYKSFIEESEIEKSLQSFNNFHPIGRIGQVEDVANAVEFLLSDKSDWITGTVLNVDGGVMAGRN